MGDDRNAGHDAKSNRKSAANATVPTSESGPPTVPLEQTVAPSNTPPHEGDEGVIPVTADNPTTLGRFKINGVLGKGGFGTVYLSFDDRLKRSVAIKVPTRALSGVALDKFLEEARRLAQLRHPGIVAVFDVGEFDGR